MLAARSTLLAGAGSRPSSLVLEPVSKDISLSELTFSIDLYYLGGLQRDLEAELAD